MINDLVISQIRQRLEILYQMVDELEAGGGGGGGGTTDYNELSNKPSIAGVQLTGNKTATDLGLATPTQINNGITDAFSPSTINLEEGGTFPSASRSLLADHKPINVNDDQYYFLEETGVDYLYGSLPTSGAYPTISLLRIMKSTFAVEFHVTGIDTVPTDGSDNLITSNAVYDAIQGAGGGGIEYVECTLESGYYTFPADKMSVLSLGNVFSIHTSLNYIACVTNESNSEFTVVVYGLAGATVMGGRMTINKTTRRVLEYTSSFVTTSTIQSSAPIRLYSTNDIDTLYGFNNKYWGSTDSNPPSNIPTGVSGQFLLTTEKFEDGTNTLQRLYTQNGEVYQRTGIGPSSWGSWYKFTGTIVT